MKKYILILLLTGAGYGQTLQNPTFGNTTTNTLKIKTNTESATGTNKIPVQETDGQVNWIQSINIPIPYIPTGYLPTAPNIGGHFTGINNKLNSIVATTAGLTTRVWFTADVSVVSATNYYATNATSKGTLASAIQNVVNNDNEKKYFAQDLIGAPFVTATLFPPGVYAGNLSASTSPNSAQQRWTVELYKCDNAGTPIASGVTGAPVGSLGVTVITILDSGLLTLADGSVTNVQVSGNLGGTGLSMAVGERVRYHVSAEKVGTAGANITQSVYYGTSYNSYIDVPVPLNTTAVQNLSGVVGTTTTDALNTLNGGLIYKKTITQIRALTGTLPSNNFYTTDLGQEGNWYYDASDTTSADNTGTILVTADGKRIKRIYSGAVNFKWFGAIGDGVANNSSLFNTVISSFSNLYIPVGTYKIQSTISLSNKTITGDKPTYNGSTLTNGTIIDGGFTITGSLINISKIGIINGLNSNGFTIRDNAQNINVTECLLVVPDHGILTQAFGGTCKNIRVFNCDAYGGIHGFVSKAENVTYENCRAFSPSVDGFAMVSDNFEGASGLNNCINNNLINCEAYGSQIGIKIYSRDYFSTNNANNVVLRGLNIVGGNFTTMSAYGILVGDELATPGGQTYNDVLNVSINGITFDGISTAGIKYSRCNGVSTVGTNTTKNYAKDSNAKNVKHYATNITGSSLGNVVFNTPLTVNSTSPTIVNGETYYDTANTAPTNIINFSGGKVGQVITVFIKDDFTTIIDSGNMSVKNNIKGVGSFVTLKFRDNASGWDEINSYITDKFQFFPYTATYTIDYSLGENARTTLTGNVTSIVFSNMVKNSYFRLLMAWDGSIRTITGWDSRIVWINGVAPASIYNSDRVVLEFYYDGTNIINTYRSDVLNLKADLASPIFTGNPTAPTPTAGDNDTSIATTAFVQTALTGSVLTTTNQSISGVKTFNLATLGGGGAVFSDTSSNSGSINIDLSTTLGKNINSTNSGGTGIFSNSSSGVGGDFRATGSALALNVSGSTSAKAAFFEGNSSVEAVLVRGSSTGTALAIQSSGSGSIISGLNGASSVFTVSKTGDIVGGVIRLKSYTVSTLPTGTQGDTAYVTDATAPTYLGTLTGGGSVKCPVFYNGSAWVSY